jgi:hypothetical protein
VIVTYRIAADLTLVVHLVFILFVVGGALLLFRFPRLVWLHVPAALWGTWVELTGRICPLTVLENRFRLLAGQAGYAESFIEHYVFPVIYPAGLTRGTQLGLAVVVAGLNIGLYLFWLLRRRKTRINRDSAVD